MLTVLSDLIDPIANKNGGVFMRDSLQKLWPEENGEDIAEYAVMLAVILVDCSGDDQAGWASRQQCLLIGRKQHTVSKLRVTKPRSQTAWGPFIVRSKVLVALLSRETPIRASCSTERLFLAQG